MEETDAATPSSLATLLYVLLAAGNAGMLLVRQRAGATGRAGWGQVGRTLGWLVIAELLCCLVLPGFHGVTLASVVSCVVHLWPEQTDILLATQGRAVLITGCDSGFGHALALRLAHLGVRVFAGVLDEHGPGALELKRAGLPRLQVLQLDVTDGSQITQAYQEVKSHVGDSGLWGLVNNAGFLGYVADGEILPMAIFRKCLEVNFLSGVEVTRVFLPLLRQAQGRLVNVVSMAGAAPMPGFSAYGASKAALALWAGVLRQELSAWGVSVSVVQPSGFKTNILGNRADWTRLQEEVLLSLPQEAKEAYGEDYICSMQRRLLAMHSSSSPDLRPVLVAMEHALLSVKPRWLYDPGASAWLIPFIHRHFPVSVYDIIFSHLLVFDRTRPARIRPRP